MITSHDSLDIFALNSSIDIGLHSLSLPYTIDNEQILHQHGDSFSLISALNSYSKHSLSPEHLSRLWKIGLRTAQRTLQATTHKCIRSTGMLSKSYRTDRSQLKYKQMRQQYGTFYVDFVKCAVKSI